VNISEKIKKVIKDKEVKDNDFAVTTGIAIDRVRNLCQGKVKKLQPHEKDAICNAYAVRPQWWEDDSVPMYLTEPELMFFAGSETQQLVVNKVEESSPKYGIPQPSAEWIILTTIAIAEAEWLPGNVKQDRSAQAALALKLYRLLVIYLGNAEPKWKWMMSNRVALQHALHFVYDLDQMEVLLEKNKG
jgi:DNA-binding Xre family transcriptional regulator